MADTVGYGNGALGPETTAITGATFTAGQSVERKANGASTVATMTTGGDATLGNNQDTNNNGADFIVRPTRQPQTKTSTAEP